jgi:N-acetylglucosaminyldiphosphoundecaprenol N-acetyl-beta-D-mannosaminyltransferase
MTVSCRGEIPGFFSYTTTMGRILGIDVVPEKKSEVLKKIQHYIKNNQFASIFSLNPEIMVMAYKDKTFSKLLDTADIKIVDGVGVKWAGKFLNIQTGERITGVDLMQELIELADKDSLRICILGGFGSVAADLAAKLRNKYKHAQFIGTIGYKHISSPSAVEEGKVQKLLKEFKPHMVFVAYGAPMQELWVEDHKQFLKSSVVMTVGGAVDFLEEKVQRAPKWMRSAGLEWLYRLILQPWRWKRQLNLFVFIRLILEQKIQSFN